MKCKKCGHENGEMKKNAVSIVILFLKVGLLTIPLESMGIELIRESFYHPKKQREGDIS